MTWAAAYHLSDITGYAPTLPLGWGEYPWNDPSWRYPTWDGSGRAHGIVVALLVHQLTATDAETFLVERGATGTITYDTGSETVSEVDVNGVKVAYRDASGDVYWLLDASYPVDAAITLQTLTNSYLFTAAGDPLVTSDGDRLYVEI